MAPQGKEVTVTAPVAGYVRVPAKGDGAMPIVGHTATKDQKLFIMKPVLAPLEALQFATLKRGVEGELKKAQAGLQLAKVELKRTLDLFRQKIKQQQDVDLAETKLKYAEEDLTVARDKLERFQNPDVPIEAPSGGTVLTVNVSPGQYVPAAAPLVTIADLSTLWVRVQIPESDLPFVDRSRVVEIMRRDGNGEGRDRFAFEAKPVALVPVVETTRHTADMIYELQPQKKGDVVFAKDQMVTVLVPVGRQRKESVVPYEAIIYDAHGGAWLYVDHTKDPEVRRYERRRVELGAGVDGGIVVRSAQGPALRADERVVTEGAALLFSREFHKTPVHPAGK
jgi:RND family efflux transporter MFP subunit